MGGCLSTAPSATATTVETEQKSKDPPKSLGGSTSSTAPSTAASSTPAGPTAAKDERRRLLQTDPGVRDKDEDASGRFVRSACALQLQDLVRRHPFLEPEGSAQAHPLHLWASRAREGYQNSKFKASQEDLRRLRVGLEAELRQVGEAFRRFDRDSSGYLDENEFRQMCAYLCWGEEKASLMDLDGDGRVSLRDFEVFVGHLGGVQSLFERRRLRATASRKDVCDYAGIVVGSRVRAHFYIHRKKSRTWKEALVIAVNMEYRMEGPGAASLGVLLEFRFGHRGKGGKGWPARQVVPMSWVLSSVEDASVAVALREVGILDDHQAFWALLLPDTEMQALARLESCQRNALSTVRKSSAASHTAALSKVQARFQKLGYGEQELQVVLDWIQDLAPVIVHLNLDSMGKFMESDEFYRNQFETHTSNGTLDNDTRKGWEHNLFGGAYDSSKPFERPKYGVLNVMNDYRGVISARQYGDSYLVLKDVRLRLTFASTDSGGLSGNRLAVLDQYAHVLQEYNDTELRSLVGVAMAAVAPEAEGGGHTQGAAELQMLRGKTQDPTSEWITVGFPGLAQRSGQFFFEVHLQSGCSAPQVGCLSSEFSRQVGLKNAQGVGDDPFGWSVDGLNTARWHAGCPKAWATKWPGESKGGERVLAEDMVVGIAVDLETRNIYSASNGAWEDIPVFTAADIQEGTALYPALSVMGRAAFCFGPDFKYPPPVTMGAFSQWSGTFGGLVRVDCPHIGNSEVLQMYKEIQIHGALSLKDNVQRLVAAEKYRQKPKASRSFMLRVVNAGPCTGTYERSGAHEGLPLYKSTSGGVIYFDKMSRRWRMNATADFTKFSCSAQATGGATSEPPRTGWEVPDDQYGILPVDALQRALERRGVDQEATAKIVRALEQTDESGQRYAYRKLRERTLANECSIVGQNTAGCSEEELWAAAIEECRQKLLREAGMEQGKVLETGHPYEAKRTRWKQEVTFEGASSLAVYFSSACCTYDSKAAFRVYAGGLLRSNAGVGARMEVKAFGAGSSTVYGTVIRRESAGGGCWHLRLDRVPPAEDQLVNTSRGASNWLPSKGDFVEAKYKTGVWCKAKITEVTYQANWYDASWDPTSFVVHWEEGGLEDDRDKTPDQIRKPRFASAAGSHQIEGVPKYGKVPGADANPCFAVCMEKPLSITVTYNASEKVGDEIQSFRLDRTCPLAPISITGFVKAGPAQKAGVLDGWYLDVVATAQGSSKSKIAKLLEGMGGLGPGGASAKAKNNRLNKLLDAAFCDVEELVRRLNENLLALTDVKLVMTNSCSPQAATLLPEVVAIYGPNQKVGDEVGGFAAGAMGVGLSGLNAPGPAQEGGVRKDWVLDTAKTTWRNPTRMEARRTRDEGPLPEVVRGTWTSDSGACRIVKDDTSNKLLYEETVSDGLLCGQLVWQPEAACWEAPVVLRPAKLDDDDEITLEEDAVGKIRAFVSKETPLVMETRIHVSGEDLAWCPPVVWRRDLAEDPSALLELSGVTVVYRQPRPTKSEIFKGSGPLEQGKRWTCTELPGPAADFEFSTDGDGADHPDRRWGVWAMVLPKEAPPPILEKLDNLAARWADAMAKAAQIRDIPQVERDSWDEPRLRALCERHGWEFEWMTEDGERRRQVRERHGLGGGRVELAGVRKVALERLQEASKFETYSTEVAGSGEDDAPSKQRSGSGFKC